VPERVAAPRAQAQVGEEFLGTILEQLRKVLFCGDVAAAEHL
jgi:hypothetical protein